eukprot:Platyproteum_vivax@DN10632_c0_g1_i1.p1
MVKQNQLKKSELIEVLTASTSFREKNRAVKLLKQFEPQPHKECDDECDPKLLKLKKYDQVQVFVCWRCDKPKQTNQKALWTTTIGLKKICGSCYSSLQTNFEVQQFKRHGK